MNRKHQNYGATIAKRTGDRSFKTTSKRSKLKRTVPLNAYADGGLNWSQISFDEQPGGIGNMSRSQPIPFQKPNKKGITKFDFGGDIKAAIPGALQFAGGLGMEIASGGVNPMGYGMMASGVGSAYSGVNNYEKQQKEEQRQANQPAYYQQPAYFNFGGNTSQNIIQVEGAGYNSGGGELEVKSGKIIKDFKNQATHEQGGFNYTPTENAIIIPNKDREKYMKSDKFSRASIERRLVMDQKKREEENKIMAEGGLIPFDSFHKILSPSDYEPIEYKNIGQDWAVHEGDISQRPKEFDKGGIHIKSSHKGRFTAYKARTVKTTAQALHSKDPHVRQMANFAKNAAKWKKADGGTNQLSPLTGNFQDPNFAGAQGNYYDTNIFNSPVQAHTGMNSGSLTPMYAPNPQIKMSNDAYYDQPLTNNIKAHYKKGGITKKYAQGGMEDIFGENTPGNFSGMNQDFSSQIYNPAPNNSGANYKFPSSGYNINIPGSKYTNNYKDPSTQFDWNKGLNTAATYAPVAYNLMAAASKPNTEAPIYNPNEKQVNNIMKNRSISLDPLRRDLYAQEKIASQPGGAESQGSYLSRRTQIGANTQRALGDLGVQQQQLNNGYMGEYANTLNQTGSEHKQSDLIARGQTLRNKYNQAQFAPHALTQLGEIGRENMNIPMYADILKKKQAMQQSNQYNDYLNKIMGGGYQPSNVVPTDNTDALNII